MLRTNDINKVIAIIFGLFLVLIFGYFVYVLYANIVYPFMLSKEKKDSAILFDSSFDEAIEFLRSRETVVVTSEGLTGASPSATLTQAEEIITAEVINGSGIAGLARDLGDELATLGITVSQVSNSNSESNNTLISMKRTASRFRDRIVDKIGTKSGEIRFEILDDTDIFDIRILIGK